MKVSRKEQKEETRRKLMAAATAELASGRSFDTLSLREVSKLAGIAPTSFYRHFHDMEGLGLALIEEHGEALVALMNDVREQATDGQSLIRVSVKALYDHMLSDQGTSRMIMQESTSPESVFREASEKLFLTLSSELADYLVREAQERGVPLGHPQLAANSLVSIMFTSGIALLNTPAEEQHRHIEAAIIKLRMIMHGAEAMGSGH
ncbi:MAG: HTH-type transcriptional repressor FabR [Gammaproteobacteria bacterium]|nr:HTH-type transcriptional repressor FabR [Gammaproteobacteria bacterium]